MDGLLSIKEAAQYLSCSEAMLRKWIHQGKVPKVKIGRLTRIRLEDLTAWIRLGLHDEARRDQP
ncbi:MAG: helix-turn-helix domain-containing protein [Nitrospira sp. BO4]|jgi:excisionase family DNA binding protein|nr:helix-turn-helix domain-containing protein [Nitrospira sp. BO4]